jgi:hypothetical protein
MKIIFFFYGCLFSAAAFCQPSDFIVLKKGQHVVKTFFPGSYVSFKTDKGFYGGKILSFKKDSLFMEQYDVRQVPTNLGVYMLDTIATWRIAFNYHDIIQIENRKRRGFNWQASGGSLLGGGILLTTVGLGTWIFTKPGTQYHAGPAFVGVSAALAGIGYLLLKSNPSYVSLGKKYNLEYIKVK